MRNATPCRPRLAAVLLLAALVLTGLLCAPQTQAMERRVALVIGNSSYKSAPLKNPANDARDMATALKSLGFEVSLLTDAGLKQMDAAAREFGQKLRQGGVGLFYFAGHGIQVAGENYLVPVDADIASEADVRFGCLNAGLVLGKMEDAGNPLNIVILDACRNNPFGRGFRSAERGLAKMDAPTGSLIAYATAPGSTAADGAGRNGLYTEHLLKNLRTPGLSIMDVFMRTRMSVVAATNKKQVPWEASSLTGYFYFSGEGAPAQAALPVAPAAPQAAPPALEPVAQPRLDPKAEKKRLVEEAARLKREQQELAQIQALQAEKDRLEADRQKLEQAKLLALGARPKQQASPAAPQARVHAAQFAALARAGLPDARASFEQAVQQRPEDAEARAGLAIALVFSGREADAKYHVQRLEESGAQTPSVRLAKGLLLGLSGNTDSLYQFSRAREEGADQALALLCQATAAERRGDQERGRVLMEDYAALVPASERGDYATTLAGRFDLPGRMVGTFVLRNQSSRDVGLFTFIRTGGVLSGTVAGFFGSDRNTQVPLENIRIEGKRLSFQVRRRVFINSWIYNVTCDLSGSLDTIPVLDINYEGKKSQLANSTLVRQASAQP